MTSREFGNPRNIEVVRSEYTANNCGQNSGKGTNRLYELRIAAGLPFGSIDSDNRRYVNVKRGVAKDNSRSLLAF